jgi:molybdopterin molybdotransferase
MYDKMISVTEAKKIISENTARLQPVQMPVAKAAGKMLAEDIASPIDFPPFPQSSMDGYAFSFDEWKQNKKLAVEGVIEAGNSNKNILAPAKAVRIFTGAPVPAGADTVVMQEKVSVKNGLLTIEDELIEKGNNLRQQGADIKMGNLALEKGIFLTPAAMAFLAGLGITHVTVVPDPRISIIVTGNELQKPGNKLEHGQVYESSSCSLTAALQQVTKEEIKIFYCSDDLEKLIETIRQALTECELVLLTGGVSVGDYDFVLRAAESCDVTKLFHKIKQRPGKPLFFGKKNEQLVFGLPGNPSSVLTCFYEYVLLALEVLTGRKLGLKIEKVPLANAITKKAMLTHFLKGFYDGKEVTILEAQESFRMSSFAKANCLVVVEENVDGLSRGSLAEIHILPQ